MNIIVHGANGRMGRMLCDRILSSGEHAIAARISPSYYTNSIENTYPSIDQYEGPADVVIDFSHHSAVKQLLSYCVSRSLPVVIATTAHTEDEAAAIRTASEQIPVFLSANMSMGIALLASFARQAAAFFPDADIEIIERHHNKKLDVPSGTALLLARSIQQSRSGTNLVIGRHSNGMRDPSEIGIHSLRYGSETGTHEIIFSNGSETVTLKHEAEDRSLFAMGAISAASFLILQTPGLYNMDDIVKGNEA